VNSNGLQFRSLQERKSGEWFHIKLTEVRLGSRSIQDPQAPQGPQGKPDKENPLMALKESNQMTELIIPICELRSPVLDGFSHCSVIVHVQPRVFTRSRHNLVAS
jgi:hypothetical protein